MRSPFSFRHYYLFSLFLLLQYSCKVQNQTKQQPEFTEWTLVEKSSLSISKDSLPKKFTVYHLDLQAIRIKLKNASSENRVVVSLPTPDSSSVNYSLAEAMLMAPSLALKFPLIKAYEGFEVANSLNSVRLNLDEHYFKAAFITPKGEFFIQPYSQKATIVYLVYKKEDAPFLKQSFEEKK